MSPAEVRQKLFGNADGAELRTMQLVWLPLLRKLDCIDPSDRT